MLKRLSVCIIQDNFLNLKKSLLFSNFIEVSKRITAAAMNPERSKLTQIGTRIREFRKPGGLSLQKIALLSGISTPALS